MSAIKTEHLTHIYSQNTPFEKVAVEDVNIEIEAGEFVGVIGHTGSGKSTFIQHLNGLLKPTSGKIYIDGKDMWEDPKKIREFRFKVGLVFQYPEYQLFEETVYKDIAFGPRNMGLSNDDIDKRVKESAKLVGLTAEMLQNSPFELSGGQKRRVAIAGVIAMEPKVLILDEPTAGLDPKGRDMILGQIKEYHKEKGNTVLLVSHSMEDIAKYTQRAIVVNKSKISMFDTIDNIFSHADELVSMGLNIPQITRIFLGLKERGFNVPTDVYTVERAKEVLLPILTKGGRQDA